MITVERYEDRKYIRCRRCQCILGFDDDDAQREYNSLYEYEGAHIKCPNCKNKCRIEAIVGGRLEKYYKENINEFSRRCFNIKEKNSWICRCIKDDKGYHIIGETLCWFYETIDNVNKEWRKENEAEFTKKDFEVKKEL